MSLPTTATLYRVFRTADADGVVTDADSTPTATLYADGASVADSVTVTNLSTGTYRASVPLSGRTTSQQVQLLISAVVDGVTYTALTEPRVIDATITSRAAGTVFSGITSLANWLGALAGKTADTTTRAGINATTAGATYNETTDSQEAVRDRGDAAWVTGDSPSGDGDILVNHNYGGTDNLIVEDDGTPVDGATILAYDATLYTAGIYTVVASARTGSDGRWIAPMMLDAGTYKLVTSAPGKAATVTALTVT
jgi:hypothetical protein